MPIDIARARTETPGCAEVLHLNNAGAALMPRPVLDTVQAHLALEARRGGYEAADAAREALEDGYDALATLLGAHRDEVAFVENATRAWDMVFYALEFAPGDRILTSVAEYASNYIAFLQVARRTGAQVEPVPNDAHGQLDLAALARMLDERVKLVAVTHVPTNGGLVQPVAAIGRLTRAAGVPFLLDACQSAGQLPLDVTALGCDALSGTGRKYLRGPRGTGFLYVRRDWLERLEPPFLDLHAATWSTADTYTLREDARRFENWETNVAAKLGLGTAVRYALDWGLPAIAERVQALAKALRGALAELPGVTVHDLGAERCGIVTFRAESATAPELQEQLRARGINVSTCSPAGALLDMEARGLSELVRASVHYYNSEDELARFTDTLRALL